MEIHTLLVAIHLLGFAFGVGGATASDLVFVRSVKDGTVSQDEYNIIKTISVVVWTSVTLLLLSGLSLMWLEYARLGEIPRLGFSFFQLKVTAFAILVTNGIVFHKKVFPYLKSTVGQSFRSQEVRSRYGMFAFTGGISIVSWYTAFLSVAFSRYLIEFPYLLLFNVYLLLILGAGTMAYLVLNMHAEESGPLAVVKPVLKSSYFKKVFLAGLVLLLWLLAQVWLYMS